MAYGRNRRTTRRTGRRGRRTLSTRSIFNNKSAKSQAKQIHALRRAVNSVRSQCKPEVKVIRSLNNNVGLALDTTAAPGTTNSATLNIPLPQIGTDDNNRIGNAIKLVNPKVFVGLQYNERNNSTSSLYSSRLRNHGIQVRLIAVQAKITHDSVPQLTDILQSVNFSTQIDSMMMLREPFKQGITSRFHILLDKRYTVNLDNPTKSFRMNIRPKTRSVVWQDGIAHPKGAIYLFVLGGGYDAVRFDQGGDYVYDYNLADFTWRLETPFTDA